MVESGRKHGPFDSPGSRGTEVGHLGLGGPRHGDGGDVLGWYAFSDRFVPNPQRHDLEALGRYEAYRGDVLGWYAFSDRFVPNPQRHDLEALGRYEAYRNATAHDPGRSAGASSAPR